MKKISTLIFLFSVFLFFSSCQNKEKLSSLDKELSTHSDISKDVEINKTNNSNEIEVFDVDSMLFNGKSKRFFALNEFETNFGKIDSTKLMSEEAPCSYIFENPDGKKDDNYLYKNGSRFENSKNKVAIDEFRFNNGNFLKYKELIFNSSTTIDDLKKLFPNAVSKMGTLDVYGEGKLQVIQLREDYNNVSDGHINVFIKHGKLFSIQWWFPC